MSARARPRRKAEQPRANVPQTKREQMIWRGLVVGLDMFMWNSTSWGEAEKKISAM